MRLGFAIAAHLDADVLLLDEVFAVGDEAFQRKCFGKIFEFKQRGGTIVFVSHDASQVERLCERAVLLREGRLEFDGADPRRDRPLPARPRRRGRSRRARRRPARVGQRRGDDRVGPARRRRRDGAAAVPRGRAVLAPPADRGRERRSRRRCSSSSSATTRGCSSPRTSLDTAGARLGGGHARSCATTSTGCRSPTAASTCASAWRTQRASGSCTGSTTRSSSSSTRPASERGVVRLEGSWAAEENVRIRR